MSADCCLMNREISLCIVRLAKEARKGAAWSHAVNCPVNYYGIFSPIRCKLVYQLCKRYLTCSKWVNCNYGLLLAFNQLLDAYVPVAVS